MKGQENPAQNPTGLDQRTESKDPDPHAKRISKDDIPKIMGDYSAFYEDPEEIDELGRDELDEDEYGEREDIPVEKESGPPPRHKAKAAKTTKKTDTGSGQAKAAGELPPFNLTQLIERARTEALRDAERHFIIFIPKSVTLGGDFPPNLHFAKLIETSFHLIEPETGIGKFLIDTEVAGISKLLSPRFMASFGFIGFQKPPVKSGKPMPVTK